MNGFSSKRRRSPDLLSVLLLVVGMALSFTLVAQAHAGAKPAQPRLAGECLTSLSVLDLREAHADGTRATDARECPRVSRRALRMLGLWVLSGRPAASR